MFASRWHSPPKPLPVLSCVTGTCRWARRSASSEPSTSPSSTPTRRSPRCVATSQHALEQRRLAGAGRAHDVHDRHAVAVEVVAVGARDRVVGVERVLDDPDLHAVHAASSDTSIDSTSSSSPLSTSTSAPRTRGQRNTGTSISHSRSHALAAQPRRARPPAPAARPRRPSRARRCPNANSSESGTTWRRRPTAHRHDRHAPPAGVARPRCRRRRTRSRTRASGRVGGVRRAARRASRPRAPARARRRASTGGVRPSPTSSTSPGSHPMTTTLPENPPIALTNRSTVAGSIAVRVDDLAVLDLGLELRHVGSTT